jgi:hypothetical protein
VKSKEVKQFICKVKKGLIVWINAH